MTPFDFFLLVVATHRGTQLVGFDMIAGPIRWRWFRLCYRLRGEPVRDPESYGDLIDRPFLWDAQVDTDMAEGAAPKLAYLLRCWWCLSIWIAAALVIVHAEASVDLYRWIAGALAASTGAVFLRVVYDRISH